MKDCNERRRFPRTPGRFKLRFKLIPVREPGYREGRAEDLSPEGVRFSCRGGVRPRTGLLLEMEIPGAQPVRSFARAAWVRELPDRGEFEVGSSFVDQSTVSRKAIAQHLENDTAGSGR